MEGLNQEQCKNCTFESNDVNLCISCNTNLYFYPKVDDALNINGFINCYNEIGGYYLDTNENIYKNCFLNCKNCGEFIGEERNKCFNCYSSNNILNFNFCFEICDYNYDKCISNDIKYISKSKEFNIISVNSNNIIFSYEIN